MPTHSQVKKMRKEAEIPNTEEMLGAAKLEPVPKGIFNEKGEHLLDRADSLNRTLFDPRHCHWLLPRSHTFKAEAGPPARIKRCL